MSKYKFIGKKVRIKLNYDALKRAGHSDFGISTEMEKYRSRVGTIVDESSYDFTINFEDDGYDVGNNTFIRKYYIIELYELLDEEDFEI